MFYSIVRSIVGFFVKIYFKFEISGLENIPKNGRLILCPNHKSNWDPIVISIVVPREIHWMGKSELFKNKILAFFLTKLGVFPVNRGEVSLQAIKTSFKILKNDEVLGIFPEGTRVKGYDIENAKPGVSLISLKTDAPIIPVYIESNYKLRSPVKIIFGKEKKYGDDIGGKLTQDHHKEISKELLKDIYSLKDN